MKENKLVMDGEFDMSKKKSDDEYGPDADMILEKVAKKFNLNLEQSDIKKTGVGK
ncbi:MAG: hypothetical protein K5750_08975 [Eubacterium sp.]|nr:hypothetical protein [Eubacterium sp.]